MTKLKLTAIGNSTGVILPKELLHRLRVDRGDVVYAIESPNGLELKVYDPEFGEQMELAERVMKEDREVLRKLGE